MLASFVTSLQHLTPLIIAVLAFTILLIFRPQIVQLVARISTIRARVAGIRVDAGLSTGHEPGGDIEAGEALGAPAHESSKSGALSDPINTGTSVDEGQEERPEPEDALTSGDASVVRTAMIGAMFTEDADRGQALMAHLRTVEEDLVERKRDEARYLALRLRCLNDQDAGVALQRLASDTEIRSLVLNMIGMSQIAAGQPSAASQTFSDAAEAADNDTDRDQCIVNQADALTSAGDPDAAVIVLERELANAPSRGASRLWSGLAHVYESKGDAELRALALNRALQDQMSDSRLHFRTAYAASDSSDDSLNPFVLHHYEHVSGNARDRVWALNNLGVTYKRVGLSIEAIKQYEAARERGNTLAMANLASDYMRSGFADTARETLDAALREDDPHPNVGSGLAELARLQEEQAEKRTELLQTGQEQAEFLSRFMQARVTPDTHAFLGEWRDGETCVEVKISDGKLSATWSLKDKSFRSTGEVHGASAKLSFEEMEYLKLSSGPTEMGFRVRATDRWFVIPDHSAIEIMRVRDSSTEMLRLTRASS